MERISVDIVNRMILEGIISHDEKDEYIYNVLCFLEKVVSYVVILSISAMVHKLIETVVFIISLSLIRRYSGGVHCENFFTCLIVSAIVCNSGWMFLPLVKRIYPMYQGGVILSMVIVFVIGSINNFNIAWDISEYRYAKHISRLSVIFETTVLLLMTVIGISIDIQFYISYAIVVCAISMLLEIRKRGGVNYEEYNKNCSESG